MMFLTRIIGMGIAVFCTATVLTLLVVLTYAWSLGHLNRDSSREIIALLKGEPRPSQTVQDVDQEEMTSYEQIVQKRTDRILSISAREAELAILKQAMEDQTNFVLNERKQLGQLKKSFQEELEAEREKIMSAAVVQARGILLKMDPESAVEKLLSLETADAVFLLKGMPEKDAARILDQFRQRIVGKEPDQRVQKAEEIYKAIYRGEPLIQPVDNARQAIRNAGGEPTESR